MPAENSKKIIFSKNFPIVSSSTSLALHRYDNTYCRNSVGLWFIYLNRRAILSSWRNKGWLFQRQILFIEAASTKTIPLHSHNQDRRRVINAQRPKNPRCWAHLPLRSNIFGWSQDRGVFSQKCITVSKVYFPTFLLSTFQQREGKQNVPL